MNIPNALRATSKVVFPDAVLSALRVWKHRRGRSRYRERTVRHHYGGDELNVIINTPYGERYDYDWSELEEIAALKQGRLRPGALVFDLGASSGVIAMMLASAVRPGGRVVALEAHPGDAELARRNGELNGLDNLEFVHAAVARTSGQIRFGHNGEVDDGTSRWGSIPVPAWSIDDLAQRYGRPDVVFIDIEGFEYQALLGAKQTLEQDPDWFVEVHSEQLARYGAASAEQVINCFDPQRYDLRAGVDRLAFVPGAGVQSHPEFRPLAEHAPSFFRRRFFLLATAHMA